MKNLYEAETAARYGTTAEYKEAKKMQKKRSAADEERVRAEADSILSEFAEARMRAADSAPAQALVTKWQAHITKHHYRCTDEILASLGEMYSEDERFRAHIDSFGEGTADFMTRAIRVHCQK